MLSPLCHPERSRSFGEGEKRAEPKPAMLASRDLRTVSVAFLIKCNIFLEGLRKLTVDPALRRHSEISQARSSSGSTRPLAQDDTKKNVFIVC